MNFSAQGTYPTVKQILSISSSESTGSVNVKKCISCFSKLWRRSQLLVFYLTSNVVTYNLVKHNILEGKTYVRLSIEVFNTIYDMVLAVSRACGNVF